MAKVEVEVKRDEFKEFYEMLELCNKGIIIDNKALIFKSKMSYSISRNVRDLKSLYQTDVEHSNKILTDYNKVLTVLRDKYRIKNPDGTFSVVKGKEQELELEYKSIRETHKVVIDENNKFLDEKEKVSIYMVNNEDFADLPQEIADKLFLMRSE